jgi:hypothetical protein
MAGSNILHVAGVRIRVKGLGNLKATFQGYDNIVTGTLVPIPMTPTDSREKTRLCNFISQVSKLRLETTEENEVMRVNHIWIYVREIYKDFPA